MEMKGKTYFLSILIGSIILIISLIVTIFLILDEGESKEEEEDVTPEEKEDWKNYDCYVFSMFWPPSSCYDKKTEKEECFNEIKKLDDEIYFTIHGLWPTYISGQYTEQCNKNEQLTISFSDKEFNSTLSKLWPGLYTMDEKFWGHEYNKHGYCYIQRIGKDPIKDYKLYFQKTIDIFDSYRDLMEEMLPDTPKGLHNVTKIKFREFLSKSSLKLNPLQYNLICQKNSTSNEQILEEIRFNYDLNFSIINNTNLNDTCPDTFQVYFSNEVKEPVYQKYDFYVFSFLWNPSTCKIKGKQCYKKVKEKKLNIFMIHGLWPSYTFGRYPQWCNIGEDVEVVTQETYLFNLMADYWIGTYRTNEYFWTHEYNKHGLCYNQRYEKPIEDYSFYFQKTVDLYFDLNMTYFFQDIYPGIFAGDNYLNATYIKEKLKQRFGPGTYALTCLKYNDKYYLNEIRLKLDMDFNITEKGKTGDDCPTWFYAEFIEVEGPQKQAIGFNDTYDMYFFTILWLGTTCHMKGEQCYDRIKNVPKNILTLHGLWPNYKNGTLPEWCNGKNDIEIEINNTAMLDFMNKHYVSGYHTNEYFWGHEYNKHGYCYNQRNNISVYDYETYFQKVIDLYLKYNFSDIFLNIYKDKIVPGDMAINRNEVEEYLDKNGIPNDTYVIVCRNITKKDKVEPHLLEFRVRFDLNFNLLSNKTDKSEFDCPDIFYAQFF